MTTFSSVSWANDMFFHDTRNEGVKKGSNKWSFQGELIPSVTSAGKKRVQVQFLSKCNHMLIVRAGVWMKAETHFTNPNLLNHDRVARFDRHTAGQRTIIVKTLTSMSFSGDRAFKQTGCTFTLSELQPELTRNCLLLGRFSNRCRLPRLSEPLKTPASGLVEQDELRSWDWRPPSCRKCVNFVQLTHEHVSTVEPGVEQEAETSSGPGRGGEGRREHGETMVELRGPPTPFTERERWF